MPANAPATMLAAREKFGGSPSYLQSSVASPMEARRIYSLVLLVLGQDLVGRGHVADWRKLLIQVCVAPEAESSLVHW